VYETDRGTSATQNALKGTLSSELAPQAAKTAAQGQETVLLVEDDKAVRAIAASGLQAYGYRVLEAQDGAEALRIFEQHADAIEMLVTDTVMPGMSGPQIAERLLESRPDLPVLLLSGYSSDVVARPGTISHAAFLQKPFTPTVLAQRVREVLNQHQRTRDASGA
jgi:CheY-like chemotaxis protein